MGGGRVGDVGAEMRHRCGANVEGGGNATWVRSCEVEVASYM